MSNLINRSIVKLLLVTLTLCHAQDEQTTPDDLKGAIEEHFREMDTDGNGELSKTEIFRGFMKTWDDGLWSTMSNDGDRLDHDEFDKFLKALHLGKDHGKSFDDLDTDGDGLITKDEARAYSEDLLEGTIIGDIDGNGDGVASFDEFFDFFKTMPEEDEL